MFGKICSSILGRSWFVDRKIESWYLLPNLENIDLAISFLEAYKIKVLKKSSFYETPSYPDITNPKFINVVIEVSGINPNNLSDYLLTGVDLISTSAPITKSKWIDFSMRFNEDI